MRSLLPGLFIILCLSACGDGSSSPTPEPETPVITPPGDDVGSGPIASAENEHYQLTVETPDARRSTSESEHHALNLATPETPKTSESERYRMELSQSRLAVTPQ